MNQAGRREPRVMDTNPLAAFLEMAPRTRYLCQATVPSSERTRGPARLEGQVGGTPLNKQVQSYQDFVWGQHRYLQTALKWTQAQKGR